MKLEEENLVMVQGLISRLSAVEQEQCMELAEHMRRQIKCAGEPIGTLAMALVGAEIQLADE